MNTERYHGESIYSRKEQNMYIFMFFFYIYIYFFIYLYIQTITRYMFYSQEIDSFLNSFVENSFVETLNTQCVDIIRQGPWEVLRS